MVKNILYRAAFIGYALLMIGAALFDWSKASRRYQL